MCYSSVNWAQSVSIVKALRKVVDRRSSLQTIWDSTHPLVARSCRGNLPRADLPGISTTPGLPASIRHPEVSALRGDDNPTNRQCQLIDRKIFAAVVMQVPTNMLVIDMLIQARVPRWPWGMFSSNRE